MTDHPESTKLKILQDLGLDLPPIANNYLKLVEFVKSISNHVSLSETEIEFMKFYVSKENEATQILEEIGEYV